MLAIQCATVIASCVFNQQALKQSCRLLQNNTITFISPQWKIHWVKIYILIQHNILCSNVNQSPSDICYKCFVELIQTLNHTNKSCRIA